LYAEREAQKGYAFERDTELQEEFEVAFPYQETADQIRCIKEIKEDMEKERPMDRLICGDVGYGKTEVAIRAIFKSVIEGKKEERKKERTIDRLLCGDVGYGKTEVAIRAIFKAVIEGKQAAILVPTTILAQQHFQTMLERFQDFPLNIELMSRFRTRKQQNET